MVLESDKCNLYRRKNRVYLYIPTSVAQDSAFPFKFRKGYLRVRIERAKLVIEPL
jgi:hypothetical protein